MAVPSVPLYPDLSDFCVALPTAFELCLPLPGGITICAQDGFDLGDPSALTRSLFEQLNSALAPLQPFLNMVDIAKSIVDCITAIPDALGPPPDPTAIANCIPGLLEKLQKLLDMLPPVWVPKMVKAFLDIVIQALIGLRMEIMAIVAEQAAIIAAATKAVGPGGAQLQLAIDCAEDNVRALIANKNAGMAPLNRLLGIVNLFLELAGLPCIPNLGALLTDLAEDALVPIDLLIEGLEFIKSKIPGVDWVLGPAPGPDDPC
jgi:hypothetical protein